MKNDQEMEDDVGLRNRYEEQFFCELRPQVKPFNENKALKDSNLPHGI
jgi:hypothetical protein